MEMEQKTKKELLTVIKDQRREIDAAICANKILEGDLQQSQEELKIAREQIANLKKKALSTVEEIDSELLDIIRLSCEDHCPHRGKEDACKNCTIYLRLKKVVGKEKENGEAEKDC